MTTDSLTLTLAAVADPTRRSILLRLGAGPAAVGELAQPLPISQQAVSKHLACLERARLIERRRNGRLNVCTLNPLPLKEVADWAETYRRFWDESFERLDDVLETMKAQKRRRARGTGRGQASR